MQVISRRTVREFSRLYPESSGPLLVWQRLLKPGEPADFNALQQLFKGVCYEPPYVVFAIGGSGARVVALVHFTRSRIYVRHVFTRLEYEIWRRRLQRKDVVRECLEVNAYSWSSPSLADVGIAMPREVMRHHERATLQRNGRFHE